MSRAPLRHLLYRLGFSSSYGADRCAAVVIVKRKEERLEGAFSEWRDHKALRIFQELIAVGLGCSNDLDLNLADVLTHEVPSRSLMFGRLPTLIYLHLAGNVILICALP